MQQSQVFPLFSLLVVVSCGETPTGILVQQVGRSGIVNGTRDPQNTFLRDGEVMAVGYLADPQGSEFCSGTLIRPRAVATARHCVQERTIDDIFFGFGVQPSDPELLVPLVEVHRHPDVDFAVLILGTNPTLTLSPLTPIDINRDPLGDHWLNRWVDAAGFGQTYTSTRGRFFASVEVVGFDDEIVHVYGHEEQGICYGDSGGPIIWQMEPGLPAVVVGTEQWGDSTCVGNDYLTRLDVVAAFVDEVLEGPLPPPLGACGDVDAQGECNDGEVSWCVRDYLRTRDCAGEGLSCGWLGAVAGHGCLPLSCGEMDFYGECDGTVLRWCTERNGLRRRDCADVGQGCQWRDDEVGFACVECLLCGGSECVDTQTSMQHCGRCDNPCAPLNATGECVAGVCRISDCVSGYADTDGSATNGCEEDLDDGCAAVPPGVLASGVVLLLICRRKRG